MRQSTTASSSEIGSASCARKRTALPSCVGSSTPDSSKMRTPTRLFAMPRRTPRRGSFSARKKSFSAVASFSGSRSSPPTTTPCSSGTRARWTSSFEPLLTTCAAAICEAPILRPTTCEARATSGPRQAQSAPEWARGRLRRHHEARALQDALELLAAAGAAERHVRRDDAAQDEVGERLLERLHPAALVRLHDRVDLLDLAGADQVPHGVVREQDLERRDAADAVRRGQQRLSDDALERAGDLHADL